MNITCGIPIGDFDFHSAGIFGLGNGSKDSEFPHLQRSIHRWGRSEVSLQGPELPPQPLSLKK